ncbi:MAG: CPBP family intramembrane glutamic endopeptidase [Chitinophagaceae bacterium]
MIGILIQVFISFLLLYFFDQGKLEVLGIYPSKKRIGNAFVILLVSMIASSLGFIFRIIFAKETWGINTLFSFKLLIEGIWWNIKSVLFEELIFRGVLLFLMIKWIGKNYGLLISSIAFGVYHWFSFEILGNYTMMLQVFLLTGVVGFLYAWGFVKSQSIYPAIAMHFGWNFTQDFLFSSGPIGKGLWVQLLPSPQITVGYFVYFLIVFAPILLFLLINTTLLHQFNKKVH